MNDPALPHSYTSLGSFPTERFKAVHLLQFFFVRRYFHYVALVFVIMSICSSSFLPLGPREGCAS